MAGLIARRCLLGRLSSNFSIAATRRYSSMSPTSQNGENTPSTTQANPNRAPTYEELSKLADEDGVLPQGISRGPLPIMTQIGHPDWFRVPRDDDDPRMIGDYPDVEPTSYQLRPPGSGVDQSKREAGELLPEDYEVVSVWSFDHETTYGASYVWKGILGLFGGFGLVYYLLRPIHHNIIPPIAPRELPTVSDYFADGRIPPKYTQVQSSTL